MKTTQLILTYLFGIFMIIAGINHFMKPDMYLPFVPNFLPDTTITYLSGIAEVVLGVGVFIPRFRRQSAFGILGLMLIFLPLHIWDVFRDNPAIGSHRAALIRLPLQLVFILWAWFITRK